jgi:hypothetical protein
MGSFVKVQVVEFVAEISNRVVTQCRCEELYSVHVLGNFGVWRFLQLGFLIYSTNELRPFNLIHDLHPGGTTMTWRLSFASVAK